jgi:hypothetical protein
MRGVQFDLEFDDTAWSDEWLRIPIALPPPARHPSGYRVERAFLRDVEIFGQPFRLPRPFECRALYDPSGTLWMSNTPQEHIMMYNNARLTRGRVLVGGLGIGLFPQYAEAGTVGMATEIAIVERSEVVADLVGPTVLAALGVPCEVRIADVERVLAGPVAESYDTIFLDTWSTLDATSLPAVNRLRSLAARHLAPDGRLLLWGYRWMVRLYEDACRELLSLPPAERRLLLSDRERVSPAAAALLRPVAEEYDSQRVADWPAALAWCRRHITGLASEC